MHESKRAYAQPLCGRERYAERSSCCGRKDGRRRRPQGARRRLHRDGRLLAGQACARRHRGGVQEARHHHPHRSGFCGRAHKALPREEISRGGSCLHPEGGGDSERRHRRRAGLARVDPPSTCQGAHVHDHTARSLYEPRSHPRGAFGRRGCESAARAARRAARRRLGERAYILQAPQQLRRDARGVRGGAGVIGGRR